MKLIRPAFLLLFLSILVPLGAGLHAQAIDSVGPVLLANPQLEPQIRHTIESFFRFGSDPTGMKADSVSTYAIDEFADQLRDYSGQTFFPYQTGLEIDSMWDIYPDHSIIMVSSTTQPDSVPYFGKVVVDWVWFLRQNRNGEWKISTVRRTGGLVEAMETLRMIDTTSIYPDVLKGDIAREESAALLDNARLRELYENHRTDFQEMVTKARSNDSLHLLMREGDRIKQLNYKLIDWGMAAQNISPEVVAAFLENANDTLREEIELRMRVYQKQLANGTDIMSTEAKKMKIDVELINDLAALMKKTRIRFLNTDLMMKDAVLFTVAGRIDEAFGFLYSPHNELPYINPMEYYYLEKIDDGWWIYRAK